MGGFTLGSYIDLENGMWQRSAVDVDLRWFSNLFLFKRSRIRQFLAFNYTQGWNRATAATRASASRAPTACKPSRSTSSEPTA